MSIELEYILHWKARKIRLDAGLDWYGVKGSTGTGCRARLVRGAGLDWYGVQGSTGTWCTGRLVRGARPDWYGMQGSTGTGCRARLVRGVHIEGERHNCHPTYKYLGLGINTVHC